MVRKFRFTARKNFERKNIKRKQIERPALESCVVKIPLSVLSAMPIPTSLPVSLSLNVFKDAPAPSVSLLYNRVLLTSALPPG